MNKLSIEILEQAIEEQINKLVKYFHEEENTKDIEKECKKAIAMMQVRNEVVILVNEFGLAYETKELQKSTEDDLIIIRKINNDRIRTTRRADNSSVQKRTDEDSDTAKHKPGSEESENLFDDSN